jgi:protein phosphatase PTC1
VKDAGVAADKGTRRRMEDTHVLEDRFAGSSSSAFFAVYDGHGGKYISELCASNFHKTLATHLEAIPESDLSSEKLVEVMTAVYAEVDENLKSAMPTSGACVVTALVKMIGEKRWLIVANAGDSRAILSRDDGVSRLTFDHKPTEESEAQRVISSGAFIRDGRVNGMIGITRALGDHCMKQWIISTPHITAVELLPTDDYLVLACDGVWDVISDSDAISFLKEKGDLAASILAKALAVDALKRGSQDNISVIVVRL